MTSQYRSIVIMTMSCVVSKIQRDNTCKSSILYLLYLFLVPTLGVTPLKFHREKTTAQLSQRNTAYPNTTQSSAFRGKNRHHSHHTPLLYKQFSHFNPILAVGWLEFNVPFQHRYSCIGKQRAGVKSYPLTQCMTEGRLAIY